DDADHERNRRVAQIREFLAGQEDRADSDHDDVQPEGGLAGLEEADLVAPVGDDHDGAGARRQAGSPGRTGRRHRHAGSAGRLGDHLATWMVSANVSISSRAAASWPCGAKPLTMIPTPVSVTCVLISPSTAVPKPLRLPVHVA